ncbi:MAG: exonuclease domain-containing protein [Cytophagales bacterium]
MFAVVDIETSGSNSHKDRIIDIAVVLHDGERVVDAHNWLLNPECKIPAFIQNLTGISDKMVEDMPTMEEVADEIYELLKDKIFVAHNVHFDYSFVKAELKRFGVDFDSKKLCTVKLSRKVVPGLEKYGLSFLSNYFGVENMHRHRALGDAMATAEILTQLLQQENAEDAIQLLLKKGGDYTLPAHIDKQMLDELPEEVGVYSFLDHNNKVLYVGKALNVKDRVFSHLSGHTHTQNRLALIEQTVKVKHELTGNDLMASILENEEIKKYHPPFNHALKNYELNTGVYFYEDQNNFMRIAVGKVGKADKPFLVFPSKTQAFGFLIGKLKQNKLCLMLSGMTNEPCSYADEGGCLVCAEKENAENYNKVFFKTFGKHNQDELSFAIVSKGRIDFEQSVLWIENGRIIGMGYISDIQRINTASELRTYLTSVYDTYDSQKIMRHFFRRSSPVKHPTLNVFEY